MTSWITFWQYAYIIGLALFFLVALAIIPLGARDLLRLFKQLGGETSKSNADLWRKPEE